jgi:DNA-binding XRE family transcriptional regulator
MFGKTRREGTMLTKEMEAYNCLPEEAKQVILAFSVLMDRIGSLPKADRDDLFELLQEWRKDTSPEERRSIRRAMEEILAQIPVNARRMTAAGDKPMSRGLKCWADHVGKKIRQLREKAGLTQVQLADKAGLPQSHISRLENAEYSATNMTLEKIANALGVTVGDMDPCVD